MTTEDKSMSLVEHIEELRRRLLVMLIALLVTVAASFLFAQYAISFLAQPVGGLAHLQSIEVTENFAVFVKVALLCGFILAFPVIIYELLRFILPGLTQREKRFIGFSIPVATIFFVGGVAFAYFIMLPSALPFLMKFLGVTTNPRLSSYFNFVTGLLFWVGLCFEFPLFIFILSRFGIVSARSLLKFWRQAIVAIAVLAAVITPTVDPVNMALMMAPLIGLYFISILFAVFGYKKKDEIEPKKPRKVRRPS
jgi:sec-independent protein translocase protein TatC